MKYSNPFVYTTAALALAMSASLSQAQLTHRYSFNSDASDSVGGANGTLMGNASVSVGQLTLDGTAGSIVALDSGAIGISSYSSLTVEAWTTGFQNTGFVTLLGFYGESPSNPGNVPANYVILQPYRGDNVSRFSISLSTASDPWAGETGANGPEINDGGEHYYAGVITPTSISLYVDGVLAQTVANSQLLSGVSDQFVSIGTAYGQDPLYKGQVNEIRIYGNALPDFAIAQNYANGPDGAPVVPEPTTLALAGFGLLGMLMARRRR